MVMEKIKYRATVDGPYLSRVDIVDKITDEKHVPFDLYLIENNESELPVDICNDWPDFLPNTMIYPIVSKRLMKLIREYLTGHEAVYWIPVQVKTNTQNVQYFILCFESIIDSINVNETTFAQNIVLRPVYSSEKLKKLAVFHYPARSWKIPLAILLEEDLVNAICKSKFQSGVEFTKVRMDTD